MLLCGLLILSGCGTPSTSLPSELVGQSSNYTQTLNILAPSFFYSESDENAEKAKQQWLDEMSARYNAKINVTSITYKDGTIDYTATQQQINVIYGKENFSGFVEINSIDMLKMMADHGWVFPLEDYLVDNPIWNALPAEVKSTFELTAISTQFLRIHPIHLIHALSVTTQSSRRGLPLTIWTL